MNRKTKTTTKTNQDEHFEALGELLTQLRTHLASEKKGTYGDYLRLLEFYRETSGRTSEGNNRKLGRPRKSRNRTTAVTKDTLNPSHRQNISPRVDIESFH